MDLTAMMGCRSRLALRFLYRQLSWPASRMLQCRAMRSSSDVVILVSLNTLGHSLNIGLVATISKSTIQRPSCATLRMSRP